MYDEALRLFEKETLYIAGPECFYTNGYTLWNAMRLQAEYYGFRVVMPSDNPLDLTHEDLRKNADEIFRNCARCMNESTAILVDLEAFRGSEPDGGSIFELGMAYARGLRCYGFTRDKRSIVWKQQGVSLQDGAVRDAGGRVLPYPDLPFSPAIFGSCKILEGSFQDCLGLLALDIEQENKDRVLRPSVPVREELPPLRNQRPAVYLAGPARYDQDAEAEYAGWKRLCREYGFDAITPLDPARGEPEAAGENLYQRAARQFYRLQRHVRDCDIVLADLNDFRGFEPSTDVSFECGMGWKKALRLYGRHQDHEGAHP